MPGWPDAFEPSQRLSKATANAREAQPSEAVQPSGTYAAAEAVS